MKSKVIVVALLAVFGVFSGSQMLGAALIKKPNDCPGGSGSCAGHSIQVVNSTTTKPTHPKVNLAALEERLNALYPR
jgi:hypothetical protein